MVETFVAIALVFWWYHVDKRSCGYRAGPLMNGGVIAAAIIALPVYFVRSRGWRQGALATAAALVAFAIMLALGELGEWAGMRLYAASRSYGGRFDRQAAPAPREVGLELGKQRVAVGRHLGMDAREAGAQPPLERPERLPLEPVERVAGRMRLRDHAAGEMPAPILIVALRAGHVELALALGSLGEWVGMRLL